MADTSPLGTPAHGRTVQLLTQLNPGITSSTQAFRFSPSGRHGTLYKLREVHLRSLGHTCRFAVGCTSRFLRACERSIRNHPSQRLSEAVPTETYIRAICFNISSVP